MEGGLVRAAGGVVWRLGDRGAVEVVLVHRPRYDDWAFPKGKLEPPETDEECALREVEEETGLRCRLGRGLGENSYRDSEGRPKVVRYWEMTPLRGRLRDPGREIDDVRWVPLDEAPAVLTYDRDRDLLARFSVPAATAVHLIRHAKASSRRRWDGPDHLRPLTKSGRRQAAALTERLDGQPLSRLVSSPHVRCVQTLEPLGGARGLAVEIADELAEGAPGDGALDLALSVAADGPAALCTHADVMQLAVQELASAGVPLAGGGLLDLAKGSTWVLEVAGRTFAGARYVPPPAE
jgi:8-oxo-(d)GTP phosphatase